MRNANQIYLDHAATTKPYDEVVSLYTRMESEIYGNSSSIHGLGIEALSYLNKARESILKSLKLSKGYKVIFTSGATEANNLAIIGYCLKHQNRGKHIITSNVEHPSVLECFRYLEKLGFKVTYLNVSKNGVVDTSELEKEMTKETILVSLMSTNNEIGSINDLSKLSQIVHAYPKAVFHSDTTQSVGKDNIDYSLIDMFVISGHKIHGLKGSGCLVLKDKIELEQRVFGGGQEDGLRSGTVPVSLCCSLAKSLQIIQAKINAESQRISKIHQQFLDEIKNVDGVELNSTSSSSPYILNFSLTKKKASVVVEALSNVGIYVSSVSACNSKKEASSYVVAALGKSDVLAHNTIRLSFGEDNK
ncbi:MAG: cysteine desulfurase [Bacilli bacterium]|nr:cysteine desulfurase [Bacilli bacterium]